jgi:hypothetical protein
VRLALGALEAEALRWIHALTTVRSYWPAVVTGAIATGVMCRAAIPAVFGAGSLRRARDRRVVALRARRA